MNLFSSSDAANDPDFLSDYKAATGKIIRGKMSVMCVRDDTDEIVGLNVLTVTGGKSDEMVADFDIAVSSTAIVT